MLPTDPAARKSIPIYSGFFKYFPNAIAAVAQLSQIGNNQHNPGQPLHWDRSKSQDELDAMLRHLLDQVDAPQAADSDQVMHATKLAWRAMANLQKVIEGAGKAEVPSDGPIPWGGGERPVPNSTVVWVRLRDDSEFTGAAGQYYWNHHGDDGDIIAYKVLSTPEKAEAPADGWTYGMAVLGVPEKTEAPTDDWIPWEGGKCPVPADTLVKVRCAAWEGTGSAAHYCWWHNGGVNDIIAYKVLPS